MLLRIIGNRNRQVRHEDANAGRRHLGWAHESRLAATRGWNFDMIAVHQINIGDGRAVYDTGKIDPIALPASRKRDLAEIRVRTYSGADPQARIEEAPGRAIAESRNGIPGLFFPIVDQAAPRLENGTGDSDLYRRPFHGDDG